MKYMMVKQFSNSAIDNIYNVFFKTVDFGKVLIEVFFSFLEIITALFLIFYNFGMYFYYLLLFFIDRGSESGEPIFFMRKKIPTRASYLPNVHLTSTPNPVPGMYGGAVKAASSTASAATTAAAAVKDTVKSIPTGTSGVKKNLFKTLIESFTQTMINIWHAVKKPFILIGEFLEHKLKPVKETEKEGSKGKSLIEEYMKEYEKKKR